MPPVLAQTSDVPQGAVVAFDFEGKSVAVTNVDGRWFAFDNACPHRGCTLADGALESLSITCPCHGSKFNITDGTVVAGPARQGLDTYQVEVRGTDLYISSRPAEPSPGNADIPSTASETIEPTQPAATPSGASQTREALATVPLFEGLDVASLDTLAAFAFHKSFAAGDVIMEEGRTGNGLYILVSGNVEVVKGLEGPSPQSVAHLGPGEPFGEMALLGDWKRSASVRALESVECIGLDRWAFLAHLHREPALAIRMLQMLADRLAQTNARLPE
jgi:nitrite reductase/ring-hydroxylating ferredoxin subunit